MHKSTNRLINESSPYLLQHAHNPVDWYAWSDEALAKARNEDKVILVSIGYSACHWCHVMERESFENNEVAEIMNTHFVNIKIDREERPDLDHIYMDAVQAMSGSGGWPLNVFLTPGGKPFFGGTYFPPVKAFNRSSWTEVLQGVGKAWLERKNEIEAQAENMTEHLKKSNSFFASLGSSGDDTPSITMEQCNSMFDAIMKTADTEWGGFGNAPKFPQTFTIQYLLNYHYFTGNQQALDQALLSIDKMLMGGIYDHVGGGLARYSTDREWLAPHFEKMLYDNALLIIVLCDAYQLTKSRKYEVAIRKTLAFVKSELLDKTGGWYAALDADSEGEEGKYYVWQKKEIDNILGGESPLFCDFFNISEQGNWEEKNVLRMLVSSHDFTEKNGLDIDAFEKIIQECLKKLSVERSKRVKPSLDDKMILSWNALMLKAVAKAAIILQDVTYADWAEGNANFLMERFKSANHSIALLHTYKNGVAKYPAFLDDYAYFVAALLELYKIDFNEWYLHKANEYCKYIIENFTDEEDVFFYFTHKDQEDVIVRKKEIYDGATPSGNAVMAGNLYQLSILFDQPLWRSRADKMLETLLPSVVKYPGSFAIWAGLVLQQIKGINEVVVIGTDFASVSKNILLNFIPNMIIMASDKGNNTFPLLANKSAEEETLVYYCRNYTCLSPFLDTNSLMQEINKTNK